jgi:hypothetical protein
MLRRAAALALVAAVAGCGGGEGDGGTDTGTLRKAIEARFAKEGVRLHELVGSYGQGGDIQLVPPDRKAFGDFVVHLMKNANGFAAAEAGAGAPEADGIRWDDALAGHDPPYYTSLKRYGDALELQWSSGKRSVDQARWQQLDRIMRELAR